MDHPKNHSLFGLGHQEDTVVGREFIFSTGGES